MENRTDRFERAGTKHNQHLLGTRRKRMRKRLRRKGMYQGAFIKL